MNRTNKKTFAALAVISGILGLAAALMLILPLVFHAFSMRLRILFVCFAAVIVFTLLVIIFACEAMSSERAKKTVVRITMILSFIVYLAVFFAFLFLLKAMANGQAFRFVYRKEWLREALPGLIPFKHTAMKLYNMFTGGSNAAITLIELGAAAFAFVPFAFFLPAMFKEMRSFNAFLPMIVFITVATELIQGMFGLGTCRIDDFLLGAGVACIAFYIFRRPRIIKFFNRKHIYF